ncbi:MAG TPA: RsmE family RNA methyltransferase, partial [Acidobacteriaceae bacterium]|nr:RsmE family RNA methyltransferase [Acidobacteriaceae bacterium]
TILAADKPATPPEHLPAEAAASPLRILLSETEEDQPLLRVLQESADAASRIMLAVGPEGGWTAAETALFMHSGWRSVSLGPRILRVETAVIAALAVVNAAAANVQTGSAKMSS